MSDTNGLIGQADNYKALVKEYSDRLKAELHSIDLIEDRSEWSPLFFPTNPVSGSVRTLSGWRKRAVSPHSTMLLTGCRAGDSGLIMLFNLREPDDFSSGSPFEISLAEAEKSIDRFASELKIALSLNSNLSVVLMAARGDAERFGGVTKETLKAAVKEKLKNPLFGSW